MRKKIVLATLIAVLSITTVAACGNTQNVGTEVTEEQSEAAQLTAAAESEAQKAEEEEKAAEEAKKAEEEKKAEEAKKAEEEKKAAEEAKKAEELEKAAEEAKKRNGIDDAVDLEKINYFDEEKTATELTLALADKDKEIAKLQSAISESDSKMKIAVMEEQRKAQENIQGKDAEIAQLKANAELSKQAAAIHENTIKEQYELKLKTAQEQVDYYKDLKTRMSTKMIGETLEIHCSTQFNQTMRTMMPNAYFEKDNDASGGSKGDFIFRDFAPDGTEYVSIMFEMKNEADETATKHKNEDFFKKLDAITVVYKSLTSRIWDLVMADNRLAPLIRTKFHGYVDSTKVLRHALEHKNEKRVYVFPTDQYPYKNATKHEVDNFLGQTTLTMTGGAALARKLGMAVEYMSFECVSRGKYKARFETICTDASELTPEEIMNRYYRLLEKDIKAQPWNYLWTHKRWKNLDYYPKKKAHNTSDNNK